MCQFQRVGGGAGGGGEGGVYLFWRNCLENCRKQSSPNAYIQPIESERKSESETENRTGSVTSDRTRVSFAGLRVVRLLWLRITPCRESY